VKDRFEIEEFLMDEQFVRWVLHPDPDIELFWNKWLDNHPEKAAVVEEAKFIARHVHFKGDKAILQNFDSTLLNILNNKYSKKAASHPAPAKFNWIKMAAVVSIIVVMAMGLLFYRNERPPVVHEVEFIVKHNPYGQKTTFVLPDGTTVKLNSDSKLRFPKKFTDITRAVELTGEAFFDVSHNPEKQFIVWTDDVRITALGTSFNVQAYQEDADVKVSLISGKVLVQNNEEGDEMASSVLMPGELASYDKMSHQFKVTEFEYHREIGWKNGRIVFESADLETFIKKIKKWYGVDVVVIGTPLSEWRINGQFENYSLELLMESLKFSKEIDYKIYDNKIIINF
jgi:transmembrane sensor